MKNLERFEPMELGVQEMSQINGGGWGSVWKAVKWFAEVSGLADMANDFVDGLKEGLKESAEDDIRPLGNN
ncbi:hypothetical protein AWW67_01535 [Roseivirga seohaensis]|uniref:Bacteriocin n=1 Tax=Roseivirga seohaensis TaxID=1914963 RepID=A0A150Y1F4_9BACT|nr:hypothetical protein [Roseivirga seohaensis]KYG84754.1 hypothetical protein AWW67_01535 [Roseivirga seohaensis]